CRDRWSLAPSARGAGPRPAGRRGGRGSLGSACMPPWLATPTFGLAARGLEGLRPAPHLAGDFRKKSLPPAEALSGAQHAGERGLISGGPSYRGRARMSAPESAAHT